MARQRKKSTLRSQLQDYTTAPIANYLLWQKGLFASEIKTLREFAEKYLDGVSEDTVKGYEAREDYQQALFVLNKSLHQKQLNEMYTTLKDKALDGNPNAVKVFLDFCGVYFSGSDEQSELDEILNGVDLE